MSRGAIRTVLVLTMVALVTGSAADAAEQSVIIGLHGSSTGPSEMSPELKALTRTLSVQGVESDALPLVNALTARLTPSEIAAFQGDPNVRYVVPDGVVATPERWAGNHFPEPQDARVQGEATPVEFYNWGQERIRVPPVHRAQASQSSVPIGLVLALALGLTTVLVGRERRRALTLVALGIVALPALAGCTSVFVLPHNSILGDGVGVAVLDTGVDLTHPDLAGRIRGGIDLVNRDNEPLDDNGHGSGVAGILAASEDGRGLVGTAPRVGLWVVKMLRYDEQGSISDLVRGIEWAIDHGADVINMSLGTDEDNPALEEAVRRASQRGVLMIAAVGNTGDRVLFPAAYPEVIAVASTDRQDRRAWFSNQGPEVELVAPGTDLLSTGASGDYQVVNGTSFSVPYVTGTAALLLSSGVTNPDGVRQRLRQSAQDLGLALSAQGHGLVDAQRAVLQSR